MQIDEAALRRKILLEQLKGEDAITLKVAAAIPEDKFGWKPVPEKAMGAAELALHAAGAVVFFMDLVSGKQPRDERPATPASRAELLHAIEEAQGAYRKFIADLSDEACAKPVDFFGQQPAAIQLLSWHVAHMVHHRGQLATYLRIMGARVPSIYGPSADDAGM